MAVIDKIEVGLGIDQSKLRSDLNESKKLFEQAFPKTRTVDIVVSLHADSLKRIHQDLQVGLNEMGRRQRNDPQALRVIPRLTVDRRGLDDFRINMQRQMRQQGIAGAVRIPVRFNGDTRAFIASVERSIATTPVHVNVVGRFQGYEPGHGPPSGGGGGGRGPGTGGSLGPIGGGRQHAGGATAGPAPAPAAAPIGVRPTRARGSAMAPPVVTPPAAAAPTAAMPAAAPAAARPVARPAGVRRGTETPSADVYTTEPPVPRPAAAPRTAAAPRPAARAAGVRPGAEVPSADVYTTPEPVQAARRTRGVQRARERTSRSGEGIGSRTVTGERMPTPATRIDISNVRGGSPVTELSGEEREAARTQDYARPTPARLWAPQPNEPRLSPGEMRRRDELAKRVEGRAQEIRAEQARERATSEGDVAARGHARMGFHTLDPHLAAMFDVVSDPEYRGSFEDLLRASTRGARAYQRVFPHLSPKQVKRQLKKIRNPLNKQGDLTDVDPNLLLYESGMQAVAQYSRTRINPLEVNLSGDTSRRGPGGKVGQRGPFTAGQMSSEAVDFAAVDEIVRRRIMYPKTRGHGWKAIQGEGHSPATLSMARDRLKQRGHDPLMAYQPGEGMPTTGGALEAELEPGKAYGNFPAPSISGGQGLYRTEKKLSPLEAAQEAANRSTALGMMGTGPRDESRYARPRRSLADEERIRGAWGARAAARASGQRFDWAAWEAEETLRMNAAFRTRPRRLGDGGVLQLSTAGAWAGAAGPSGKPPKRSKRGHFGVSPIGKPGVHFEYLQGGRRPKRGGIISEHSVVNRDEQGRARGVLALTHFDDNDEPFYIEPWVDPAQRGKGIATGMYAHAEQHGYRVERASDLNAREGNQTEAGHRLWLKRKRAMGWTEEAIEAHRHRKYRELAEGGESPFVTGLMNPLRNMLPPGMGEGFSESFGFGLQRGKKRIKKRADGGGLRMTKRFQRLPEGFQAAAQKRLGGLSEQYGIPLKLGAFSPRDIGARLAGHDPSTRAYAAHTGSMSFNEDEMSTPGRWGFTMSHEFGHVLDSRIPFRARNKFMKGAIGTTDREEFADMFGMASRFGKDPHGILPFVEGAGRTRLPAVLNKALGDIHGKLLDRGQGNRLPTVLSDAYRDKLGKLAEGGLIQFLQEGGAKRRRPNYAAGMGLDLSKPLHGTYLRAIFGEQVPRMGSRAREEMNEKAVRGIRNREKYEKKPLYQRGGNSDPKYNKARAEFLIQQRAKPDGLNCSFCGQPTVEGQRGPLMTTVDHTFDTASGGDIYDLKNFNIMCNRHNGLKAGGKSARKLEDFQARAEGGITWLQGGGDFAKKLARSRKAHDYLLGSYGVPDEPLPGSVRRLSSPHATATARLQRAESVIDDEYGVREYFAGASGLPGLRMQRVGNRAKRVVARNKSGEALGVLDLAFSESGKLMDQMPFVHPDLRGKGIGSALYAKAKALGIPVDEISEQNRLEGMLTEEGAGLFKSRKRHGGRMPTKYRAEGGEVRFSGLFNRLASGGHAPNLTMVGERGPELMVSDPHTGETEVIPTHKVPGAMDRLKGRADGGTGGRLHMRDTMGRSQRATVTRLTSGTVAGGDITRVFVVNWPSPIANNQGWTKAQKAAQQAINVNPAAAAGAAPNAVPGLGGANPQGTPNAPGPGAARGAATNPLLRTQAREIALGGERGGALLPSSFAGRLLGVRSQISEAQQLTPVRALSVAFGQISQTVIGGRAQIQARERRAGVLAERAQRADTALTRLREQEATRRLRIGELKAGAPEAEVGELGKLQAAGRPLFEARRTQAAITERRTGQAEEAAGGILTRGQQVRSQLAGLGGIIGGTAVFTASMAAFQTVMQAASVVIDPFIQAMTGFPAAVERSTGAVRDSITQMKGDVEGGAAAALAPSGVSARFLERQGQAVIQTGQARAAQLAAEQARDITRTAGGLGGQVRGRYEGVGGLFGTNIGTELFGGQPGFLQTITGRLGDARRFNMQRPTIAGVGRERTIGETAGERAGLTPMEEVQQRQAEFEALATATTTKQLNDNLEDLNTNLQSAADYAGESAEAFKLIPDASKEAMDAMVKSAEEVGPDAKARALELQALGIAAVGPGGRQLTGKDFDRFTQALERGSLIQDPQLLMRATQRQRESRAFMTMEQGRRQRTEDIPARFALQEIANPPLPFGQTFRTEGLAGTKEGQKTLDNIAKYSELAAKAGEANEAATTAGMAAMEKIVSRIDTGQLEGGLTTPRGIPGRRPSGAGIAQIAPAQAGGPGPALTQFRGLISDIGDLGQQIAEIQAGINQRQVNLQVKEYNNQIRIATRSLGDAQDLWAGIHGDVSGSLGGLQGQNMLLERQNQILGRRQQRLSFKSEDIGFKQTELQFRAQQLQFEQSQRQINFQVAVAGFTAPGMTSEERGARIEEAKIEAAYAQEQLDIQIQIAALARDQFEIAKQQAGITREMFGNQVQQQDNQWAIQLIEAQRAMTDISAQLALLQEGRAVVIDTAAAEESIARLRKQQGRLMDQAESMIAQGQEARSQILEDIAMAHEQTGKGFQRLVKDVGTAWSQAIQSYYNNFLTPLLKSLSVVAGTGAPKASQDYYGGGGAPSTSNAAGTVQTVNSPTNFLAGEAGTEHVIVLRNAKQGMFVPGGGGGGGGSIVNVGGIVIQLQGGANNEEDAERLAAAVERRLGNKLALIGA